MNFTFGICVTEENKGLHDHIIDSIYALQIPDFEILMIGPSSCENPRAKLIEFRDAEKKGWITRKKNLLCQTASYENIVLLHDYIVFHPYWYESFAGFADFDLCMSVILNSDGSRFRDWTLNPYRVIPPAGPLLNREFSLPYHVADLTEKMYISGTYWVAKTQYMLENPLDENLVWGESEDIEWSNRVLNAATYKMNPKSIVQCLKYKYFDFELITDESLQKVRSL